MRFLVPCGGLVLTGGLLRFERTGRILRRWGHDLAFATPGEGAHRWTSTLPTLSLDAARTMAWDAVMVPGGGHPDTLIAALRTLREPSFGLRVQHLLNGPPRKAAYLRVTEAFDPDLIVINNQHWTAADLADFPGRPIAHLIGAVDSTAFAPPTRRSRRPGRRRLGAIANKNPRALLDALERLGPDWELHWFGRPDLQILAESADRVAEGRLVPRGVLLGDALAAYYHDLDVFCSAEPHAGWCNPAAEAMASGTPLVTTQHGTRAFAQHEATALILDAPTGTAIAEAVLRLDRDPDLADRLAARGRAAVRDLTWDAYASALLRLVGAAAG
jgi:glycosyltransferase involved in cell wall biosynthesis